MFREAASIGVVLRVLADASVFRAGSVLVGTQAFPCIANMLQAEQLLEVLVQDRPGDIMPAWAALRSRKPLRSGVKAALGNLEPLLRDRLALILDE